MYLPFEIHCHGLGPIDFSDIGTMDLDAVEAQAAAERLYVVPTMYMPQAHLEAFEAKLEEFAEGRENGRYEHLLGFALEGPLLGSVGGTPKSRVWIPTLDDWKRLATLGPKGLRYTVMSPDVWTVGDVTDQMRSTPMEAVVSMLLENGVSVALGHFRKSDPQASADAIDALMDVAASSATDTPMITDHLFNDMPVNVKYAWRTAQSKERREVELEELHLDDWVLADMEARLGPVPARLFHHAHAGRLKTCLNFDGEHVDTEVAMAATRIIGAENVIAMTDRTDVARLGGQDLHLVEGSTLWFQDEEVVAAGSRGIHQQRRRMLDHGMTPAVVDQLTIESPAAALGVAVRP